MSYLKVGFCLFLFPPKEWNRNLALVWSQLIDQLLVLDNYLINSQDLISLDAVLK